MPELPEIETVKLQLSKYLVGQTLEKIEQLHKKSVTGDKKQVTGKKVTGVERKGKMLIIDLESNWELAIHFKMSGQLILVTRDKKQVTRRIGGGHPSGDWLGKLPSKHTRAIFYFSNGDVMYFNDQRIFGWVKIMTREELDKLPFILKLGKEPWDLTDKEFHELIIKRKRAIKLVIMDQEVLSGVGNIYANDALWEARLYPVIQAQRLRYEDTKRLRMGLIKVLKEGIKYGGATAADAKYMDLHGLGGQYQEHFRTYDREGEKCLRRDKGVIKKITLGGRGTYFCPICQKFTDVV